MSNSESHLRGVLRAGLPGCMVAVLCLSFFLTKAFTIDDTIFLRAAEQATRTPSHPYAFDMCWDSDGKVKRFSRFVANAPLMGYALVPVVRSDKPEVEGHVLELILLTAAILATASLALRLGLSVSEAFFAATFTATCPVVLGMAATVMPDILAMTLAVIGVERFVAWQKSGSWWSAALACAALALGPLARPHLVLMLPVCALLCVQRRRAAGGLAIIAAAGVVYFGIAGVTRDPAVHAVVIRNGLFQLSPGGIFRRALSAGCNLAFTTPFVAGGLLLLFRERYWRTAALFLLALPGLVYALTRNSRWSVDAVSPLAYFVLGWALLRLWKMRSGTGLALGLWTLLPLAMVVYLHMATKFLVPSVPAYSLILVLLARETAPVSVWMWRALPAAGLALGLLIVSGDTRQANLARSVVREWMPGLELQGHRVLFLGQWGFQWYAELHGAQCFDPASPRSARAGDFVVVDVMSNLDRPFPVTLYPQARLAGVISDSKPGGVVMDAPRNVGFYSDGFGPLPWSWEPAGTTRFELWKIE